MIAHLVPSYGYYAVFALIALESLGIPLPGESALIAAALYAGTTHHLNIAAPSGHTRPPAPCSAGTARPRTPDTHRPAAPQPGQPGHRNGHANRPAANPQHAPQAPIVTNDNPSRLSEMTRKITCITCM